MEGGNILYMIMLLALVGGAFFTMGNKSDNIRHLLIWAGVILVLVFGYNTFQKYISTPTVVNGEATVKIPFNQRVSGYLITMDMNGETITALVDTGASEVVLTHDDARAIGINTAGLSYSVTVNTANGSTQAAPTEIKLIEFGRGVNFENQKALVSRDGDLDVSLIGMGFLRRLSSVTIADDQLLINF